MQGFGPKLQNVNVEIRSQFIVCDVSLRKADGSLTDRDCFWNYGTYM